MKKSFDEIEKYICFDCDPNINCKGDCEKIKEARKRFREQQKAERLNPALKEKKAIPSVDRRICCYDRESGKLLGFFNSVKEANLALGVNPNSHAISAALHGAQDTSYGYVWRYARDKIKRVSPIPKRSIKK